MQMASIQSVRGSWAFRKCRNATARFCVTDNLLNFAEETSILRARDLGLLTACLGLNLEGYLIDGKRSP
jgi:hypothetical protein